MTRATMRSLCFAAGALPLLAGCSAKENPPPVGVNCAASNSYDFQILETYDEWTSADASTGFGWYGYQDTTPGGSWLGQQNNAPPAVAIENGGPCPSSTSVSIPTRDALVLAAHGFQDWGNGWGTYSIGVDYTQAVTLPDGGGMVYTGVGPQNVDGGCTLQWDGSVCPINGQGWDGISFWARSWNPSGDPTSKGFTLEINDSETSAAGPLTECTSYDASIVGGIGTYATGNVSGAAGGGTAMAVPPANACGNSFNQVFLTTDQWTLYTFPWSSFHQLARPGRSMTGFDASKFMQILIQAPKEALSYLWIDSLGFYRVKTL